MLSFAIENYRVFGSDRQNVHLAPLTLLVGENSTGKTSFLALLRAMWDLAYENRVPDFQEPPYDLGAFRNIVHNRDRKSEPSGQFRASFSLIESGIDGAIDCNSTLDFSATFEERDNAPYPVLRKYQDAEMWIEAREGDRERIESVTFQGYDRAAFEVRDFVFRVEGRNLTPLHWMPEVLENVYSFPSENADALSKLMRSVRSSTYDDEGEQRPYASAPIRSYPQRIYRQNTRTRDPEGEGAIRNFALMSLRGGSEWSTLQSGILEFGQMSGLFSGIEVVWPQPGNTDTFEIQVRLGDSDETYNLADVGYGVSQILPILIEFLQPESPRMFLFQQPEVHLHPRAQAALALMFCLQAVKGKQVIVETHSNFLIDRVRMAVRDRLGGFKPTDVSILYFEPCGGGVKIQKVSVDHQGNVNAPPSYGDFFMKELERSVGFRKLTDAD